MQVVRTPPRLNQRLSMRANSEMRLIIKVNSASPIDDASPEPTLPPILPAFHYQLAAHSPVFCRHSLAAPSSSSKLLSVKLKKNNR